MNSQEYISSGIIESYVLGMADAQEVAELELLRNAHPEIQAAIDSFEASLENAALANAIAPAADTKVKLMFILQDEFAKPSVTATTPPPVTEARLVNMPLTSIVSTSTKKYRYMVAAAAILLVASAGLNVYFYGKYDEANKQVVALLNDKNNLSADNRSMQAKYIEITSSLQLVSDTNMVKVALKGIAGKEANLATVYWNNKSKDVYLLANNLPKAPEGKQYQLWALVNGKPIDAGMLENCNGVCKLKNTVKADVFAITLEKTGGSQAPDLTQLYVLGKVSS